jgi:hypothetical protein
MNRIVSKDGTSTAYTKNAAKAMVRPATGRQLRRDHLLSAYPRTLPYIPTTTEAEETAAKGKEPNKI